MSTRLEEYPLGMDLLWNMVNSLLWILAIVVIGHGLTQRYSIGIDDQKELCLEGDHRWYLIDRWERSFAENDLMAFEGDTRVEPFFQKAQTFIKRVKGLPGQTVDQQGDVIRVNREGVGRGFPLMTHPGIGNAVGESPFRLQPMTYWVMGDQPKSFDSRYWGVVYQQQIIGKAYALPF
jgi:conjugal transfer pilin signal peptidase TrbI